MLMFVLNFVKGVEFVGRANAGKSLFMWVTNLENQRL